MGPWTPTRPESPSLPCWIVPGWVRLSMAERQRSLCVPRPPDFFSINSSVSLKSVTDNKEGMRTRRKRCLWWRMFRCWAQSACYTLTWRCGIDAAEEKPSGVQNRGGQGLMAAHFSLKTLIKRPSCFNVSITGSAWIELREQVSVPLWWAFYPLKKSQTFSQLVLSLYNYIIKFTVYKDGHH